MKKLLLAAVAALAIATPADAARRCNWNNDSCLVSLEITPDSSKKSDTTFVQAGSIPLNTARGVPVILTISNDSDYDIIAMTWGCRAPGRRGGMIFTGQVKAHSTETEVTELPSFAYQPGDQQECKVLEFRR
jgi:hypothetical protein